MNVSSHNIKVLFLQFLNSLCMTFISSFLIRKLFISFTDVLSSPQTANLIVDNLIWSYHYKKSYNYNYDITFFYLKIAIL